MRVSRLTQQRLILHPVALENEGWQSDPAGTETLQRASHEQSGSNASGLVPRNALPSPYLWIVGYTEAIAKTVC